MFQTIIDTLLAIIWSPPLVYGALTIGLWFSFRTGFAQVRHFGEMGRLLGDGKASGSGISSFQALAVSISGRVGTGNIAGVASAIAFGGPGAVVWMWIIAFLGASSAYVEAALGQLYKENDQTTGEYRGGPAYYIEKGFKNKKLAIPFAIVFTISTILATGFFLPGIQANAIVSGIETAFNIPKMGTAILLVSCLGVIIFGGIKRIGKVAEYVVPFMSVTYILIAIIVLVLNVQKIPEMFGLMISSAFGFNATFGGILGSAIAWGVKRGIYSNEAGQGTAPHAAAAAEVSHPAKQGLVQAFSVYIDTLFVCSATAFLILSTGAYNIYDPGTGSAIVENLPGVEVGPGFTQAGVEGILPGFGAAFVGLALLFFAFTTIMAYYYQAEVNVTYLNDRYGHKKWLINLLRILLLMSVFLGTQISGGAAWGLGDIGVGLMAWLNLVAILILQKPAIATLRDYEKKLKSGNKDVRFKQSDIGLNDPGSLWD